MAKRKIIWSNTAIKRLYAIFESDIREGNGKAVSIKLFQTILRKLKVLKKDSEIGIRTSEESIYGLPAGTYNILYSIGENEIFIHTLREVRSNNSQAN